MHGLSVSSSPLLPSKDFLFIVPFFYNLYLAEVHVYSPPWSGTCRRTSVLFQFSQGWIVTLLVDSLHWNNCLIHWTDAAGWSSWYTYLFRPKTILWASVLSSVQPSLQQLSPVTPCILPSAWGACCPWLPPLSLLPS